MTLRGIPIAACVEWVTPLVEQASKSARHPIKESDFFALLEKDSSNTLVTSPDEGSASPIRLTPEFS
jgi:hypothetical protein